MNRYNFFWLLEYRVAAAVSPEVKNHHIFPEENIQKKTVDSNFKVTSKSISFSEQTVPGRKQEAH